MNTIKRVREDLGKLAALRVRAKSGRSKRGLKLKPERRSIAFASWADGKSDAAIASDVGISLNAIQQWRRTFGLPSNRTRRAAPKPKPLGAPITPMSNDLYRRCDAAVSRALSSQDRGDVIADMFVAIQAGDLAEVNVERDVRRFENKVSIALCRRGIATRH